MLFSVIIPVFNRPNEIKELLESLTHQIYKNFDVWVIEDGSEVDCREVVAQYENKLKINYCQKPNSGPADSRNYGMSRAEGEWFIILDSDCIVPKHWLQSICDFLKKNKEIIFFGGPDEAHPDFTPFQKGVSYAMTSFLTTGGIRGGKKTVTHYYPRSFNMGVKKEAALGLNGFDTSMRFGEDLDFSMRLEKAGYKSALIADAWVWHKRRTKPRSFFKQIFNSGMARVALHLRHPSSLKLTHLFPTVFFIGLVSGLLLSPFCLFPLIVYGFYFLLVGFGAVVHFKNLIMAIYAVWATFLQHSAYGCGFLIGLWKAYIKKEIPKGAFQNTFYK